MSDAVSERLKTANRQVDTVIREITILSRDTRDARTVSKVILIAKLDRIQLMARELERTLELMMRDDRSQEFEG